ncbi:hypothetical protein DRN69_01160 [Candidatus Pacearchaeota archaeon]|nr:MAG: hypothetical protein DRN69_01160 [Candidatus Pacearchaeota archaeon]
MVNQDILGGLKSALERGESLKQAMMTFYNAGYRKEEIEEAARALKEEQEHKKIEAQKPLKSPEISEKKLIKSPKLKEKIPSKTERLAIKPPKASQKISGYEQNKKPNKIFIIVLIIILFVLFSILAITFLFRRELIEFFNRFF